MQTEELHNNQHGVAGMVGSLDCMHVGWKNCPVAWQGTHKGKEGHPTIVLEAMADYNLFIWHASFGWAGTLNDLNIWEASEVYREFLDGTWAEMVDFPFTINGQEFTKLYVLVDGIYPELARFVKPISEPIGRLQLRYASWQEASRKDIERAFGVLQRKFHILVKKLSYGTSRTLKRSLKHVSCFTTGWWCTVCRMAKKKGRIGTSQLQKMPKCSRILIECSLIVDMQQSRKTKG